MVRKSLSMFLVPGQSAGVTVEESIETIGQPGAEVCVVRYDSVRVPRGNLVGEVGDGIVIAETAFTATVGLVGAMAVGVARKAFSIALEFARTERRGGSVPIIQHQNVATILSDMEAKIEAARYLTWKGMLELRSLRRPEPGAEHHQQGVLVGAPGGCRHRCHASGRCRGI